MKLSRYKRSQAGFSMMCLLVTCGVLVLVAMMILPAMTGCKARAPRISCVNNLKNIGLAFRTFAVDNDRSLPWTADGVVFSKESRPLSKAVSGDLIRIFASVSNELSTPRIIMCPSDTRRLPRTNTWSYLAANDTAAHLVPSYFIGLASSEVSCQPVSTEEQPQTILSGDRNVLVPPALDWTRVTGTMPAWRLHEAPTNALSAVQWGRETIHQGAGNLLLADGSVQQVSSGRLRDAVRDARRVTDTMTWLMPVDH
jgi:prepilin-type processing-associated H-X9-DG protein